VIKAIIALFEISYGNKRFGGFFGLFWSKSVTIS